MNGYGSKQHYLNTNTSNKDGPYDVMDDCIRLPRAPPGVSSRASATDADLTLANRTTRP